MKLSRFFVASLLLIGTTTAQSSVIFDLEDATNGGGFFGKITISNIVGGVNVIADVSDPINANLTQGDILELGFDLSLDSVLSGMSAANFGATGGTETGGNNKSLDDAYLSSSCFIANDCDVFNGGGGIGKNLDIGLQFWRGGARGGFIETLTIDLLGAGLNEALFGELAVMRVQSIDGTDYQYGSSKLAGSVSVPEPSILALFGAGIIGLGFARRRKLRQS